MFSIMEHVQISTVVKNQYGHKLKVTNKQNFSWADILSR